jgi:hypothetical protein
LLEDPNVPESFRAAIAGLGASSFGPKGVCAGCEWDKHLGKESPVERIECFDPTGTKKHCHLDVVGYKPKRDVWIRDSGGKLSFSVVSDGDPSAGMECEAEIVAAQPQLISGECTVREQHLVGDPIHNFGALIVEEDAKPLIKFWFWHKGEQKNGNPIHSGEGHSYPDP